MKNALYNCKPKQLTYAPLALLLLFCSCKKENVCREQLYLGSFDIEEQTLDWNPYFNHSQVVFVDSLGEEYAFKITNRIEHPKLKEREFYQSCEFDDNVIVTYRYISNSNGSFLELEQGDLDLVSSGPMVVNLSPRLHSENPKEKLLGEFLSVSHSVSSYFYTKGIALELIVNQGTYPKVLNNIASFLPEYSSNGKTYFDVYTNQEIPFNTTWITTTSLGQAFFGGIRMYYNKEYGIIEMQYINGKKLYFKEII